jgi:class 3 adenylate cyclase/tetratricopeptide (TPR) repeat protein
MKCPQCEHDVEGDAKFCEECGASLARRCANCGRGLSSTAKFCPECAQPAAPPPEKQLGRRPGQPGVYAPKHLAENILTSRIAVEGERKQVTVLFADMQSSTEIIADRDPEEARKILDPLLDLMMDAVRRYEGTVNQVMGDGIMALFGAPLAHEDHAIRACYAALRMRDSIKRYAQNVAPQIRTAIHIRIGLHSGEVDVRTVGSDLRMDYTAVGLTTHLAARMEQSATPDTIRITSKTYDLAAGYVEVRPLGAVLVKGVMSAVPAYEVVGATTVRSRLRAVAARGLTRFVGRGSELEQLGHASDRAREGHGQVLAVVGEPGVGKSRLLHEFVHSNRTEGWRILEAGMVSHGLTTSYSPIIDLVKEYFEIATDDEPPVVRDKVTSTLRSLDGSLQSAESAILALLDSEAAHLERSVLDARQRRQQALADIKRLLVRHSQVQPLVVIFEDLQWIDAETQAFLDGLVESLPTAHLLLLVSYRPEYRHTWGGKTYYWQVRVDPLPPARAGELLDALLGTDVSLTRLKQALVDRTEGNPFFLEESARTVVESEALAGGPGAYRVTRSTEHIGMPATVEAVLASRIDRLSPEDKRLLQCAAAVGSQVPEGILREIADVSDDDLRLGLARLRGAEFLYENRLFPQVEYIFKHALTHEVAYQMLTLDRRRALHAAILTVGEGFYAGQAGERAAWLAFHAIRGHAWDRAVSHLLVAAVRAIARAANRVAAQHLENALAALDRLPPSRERTSLAIDVRIDLRHALTPLGQVQSTLEHLRVAEGLALELGDTARMGRVASFIVNCLVLQGRYREALGAAERALALARELDDQALHVATQMYVARARLSRGECECAIEMLRGIIDTLDTRPRDDFLGLPVLPAAFARSHLAVALAETGAFTEAERHAEEASRRAEVSGQPDSIMFAQWSAGSVALVRGHAEEAVGVFDRLLALCRAHDLDAYVSRIMAALGCARARVGKTAEGISLLEHAAALDSGAEPQTTHTQALTALSEAYFLGGDLRSAVATADRALKRATTAEERGAEAYACWVLGMALAAGPGRLAQAEERFMTATGIATQLGLRPLLAHCDLGLGDLYQRQGEGAKARDHSERGLRLLEVLLMKPWIPRLGIPSS